MEIFVNRILNMKKIKAIGFDMDHTLIRYDYQKFEEMAYDEVKRKLVELRGYPKIVLEQSFNPELVIKGLVIDKKNGNTLKINQHGRIKTAFHGTTKLTHREYKNLYRSHFIDLSNDQFVSMDTSFSTSHGCLYAQLVDLKMKGFLKDIESYEQLAEDVENHVDLSHRDGSIKNNVVNNLEKYIVQDEKVVRTLEKFRSGGKKLLLITNSDYKYTKKIMDFAYAPFMNNGEKWEDLFEFTITLSRKPKFFTDNLPFLKIDEKTALMENIEGEISPGVYQGGNANTLQETLKLEGDEILYLGDHIYGDVLALKKSCFWRTALVLEELETERVALRNAEPAQLKINELMNKKGKIDFKYQNLKELNDEKSKKEAEDLKNQIEKLDAELKENIQKFNSFFNPYFGQILRAGQDPSHIAGQVERYACIYMSKVSDLHDYANHHYFRPVRRSFPHELF